MGGSGVHTKKSGVAAGAFENDIEALLKFSYTCTNHFDKKWFDSLFSFEMFVKSLFLFFLTNTQR